MLNCYICPKTYEEDKPRYKCDCGGFLVHQFDKMPTLEPKKLANRPDSWWRYQEALPLADEANRLSLGEKSTPLSTGELAGEQVLLKIDGDCPTGSFKDRGSFLMVSKLREWGLKEIVGDSSGNAGASIAAYAQVAGITARIYAPGYTDPAKLDNIRQYNPELITVDGSREETSKAAMQDAERSFYASHNWSPYFVCGVKTLAYELWEQLGFQAPEAVLVPVGGGSGLLGMYYGFLELAHSGRIERMPRLIAVQSEACPPLYEALLAGADTTTEVSKAKTIAEGIVIANPVKGRAMIRAVRETNGACLTVTDEEVVATLANLQTQGFQVEPTSGVGAAGFIRALQSGLVSNGQKVVVELTGRKK
jgi:threonine synthase